MSNIASVVQAEFFLGEDALKMKQVVRFFDEDHTLTLLALELEVLEAKKSYYLHRLYNAIHNNGGWFEKKYCTYMCKFLDQWALVLHRRKVYLTCKSLGKAVASGTVAVERLNRTFRPAFKNELPRLLAPIQNARGVWLFIFNHTGLCSTKDLVSVAKVF